MKKWHIEDSAEMYNINGWGVSYFGINEKGHVMVTPKKNGIEIDLREVMDELALRDIGAPVLLRFPDILDNRIESMSCCYKKAAAEYGFKAECFSVYPIKVNQMHPVVEEVISHGQKFNLGLEAGSKPELHAVIAVNAENDSLIICNGYKDASYIELALLAQKMGKRVYLVIEKMNELDLIAEISKRLNIRPKIGIRIKLGTSGSGKWEDSGGDASKFGLTSSELLEALHKLEEVGLADCLKLIHFHIGSQVTNIRHIKTAIREASQFYVQLYKMGFPVDFIDAGGGLGVDYDGTRSASSESSVNYSMQEYVNDVMYQIMDAADKNQQIRDETLELFSHGLIDLKTRAQIEKLYWSVTREINSIASQMKRVPEELHKINKLLADKYFCNFSLFQSLPDSWGVGQVFPIMPLQRLNERPERHATLQDITCDSDGKVASYIAENTITNSLPVHALRAGEPYYLGVFLVGAYQEILGDMHNLFGDTNAVHISVTKDGYKIDQTIDGETIDDVLDYVDWDSKKMVRTLETWVKRSIKQGRITLEEGKEFLNTYRSGLYGYTYLE